MADTAANGLLNISMITTEALRVLENQLTFTRNISREYDDKFAREGAKIGTTLNVRRPVQYIGRTGQALSVENSIETTVPLVLNTQRGVDMSWSSAELELSIDDFSERFITPAVASVSNHIDLDGLALANSVYWSVGVPGVPNTNLATYLAAKNKLDLAACPKGGQRSFSLDPIAEGNVVQGLLTLFNPQGTISKQYESGYMGEAIGFKWGMDQNVAAHTFGPGGGTPAVNGAGQGLTAPPTVPEYSPANAFGPGTLVTNGWPDTMSPLNVGDVFTIQGVFAVNPQSRQSTNQLAQFTVAAPTLTDGSGNLTITMYPALYVSGQYQNVTGSPANGALIFPVANSTTATNGSVVYAGASPQALGYHKDAFTFASADLPLPRGVDMAARVSDKQLGISIRMVRAYDITVDFFPCRLDVLYGWAALRPELAVRIMS